ncbi:MAG: hypothetical protein M0Z60_09190 [Nitrospiraceae bacterium]|nr:hypothetical protein [Nitrospiraceae bacterium]
MTQVLIPAGRGEAVTILGDNSDEVRMRVYVDNKAVDILPGMTVRHALISAGLLKEIGLKKVYDEWGNEIGLDGALAEGAKIFLR